MTVHYIYSWVGEQSGCSGQRSPASASLQHDYHHDVWGHSSWGCAGAYGIPNAVYCQWEGVAIGENGFTAGVYQWPEAG